ncbi:metallophosphoesterase [Solicola sp. PLA-1-18]|uniref:metallophosphoesterase family protein n=1 Tax=Solicola sp. PLA-1-18 TaxID=3380532 RepID=UPI003B7E8B5F
MRRLLRPGALLRAAVLLVVGVLVAVGAGLWSFDHASRTVVIGAHTTTVQPTFDGHATLDFGPLLPQMRLPTDQPANLGVRIRVGDTDADDVNQLVVRDAVIASQPAGEIQRVSATVRDMARSAILVGVGWGLLAVLVLAVGWSVVGERRRAEVGRTLRRPVALVRRRPVVVAAGATALVAGLALVAVPVGQDEESASGVDGWRPLRSYYPELDSDPVLDRVELARSSATRAGLAIVDSAISTYQTSQKFYGDLEDSVDDVADQVRQPSDDETVAVFVTDRHDNIGMDPVAAAIGRVGGASVLIDGGDDTSSGGSWERFSINSIAREFRDYDRVGVVGNHDTGPAIPRALADEGFTVLDGERADVGGIAFIGDADPRSSGFTAEYTQGTETLTEQDERLTEAACADDEITTAVVHSAASATELAQSGCVDLVLSGHLHRQVGPTTVDGPDGAVTTTFTGASTGGAVYAFALGSKLRRPAQVTLVTFADGRPVGLQPVDLETGGQVQVQDYYPLPSSGSTEPTTP